MLNSVRLNLTTPKYSTADAKGDDKTCERWRIAVQGTIQGVGFRPFVFRLASRFNLAGFVRNTKGGVTIEIEGPSAKLHAFIHALEHELPPLAEIQHLKASQIPPRLDETFMIISSDEREAESPNKALSIIVPPDVATCERCLEELADQNDRRHLYPFINCTDCGPRYTIIKTLPYDRMQTTMADFELCPSCQREYLSPTSRRFHAEPIACPTCGPRLELVDCQGRKVACSDPLVEAERLLLAGKIGAIKGLGGFHLACDASQTPALKTLRARKHRPAKPFAVMALDLQAVERFALFSEEEQNELLSWHRPIVLLRQRTDSPLSPLISGDNPDIGVMLPYTPLHQLLLRTKRFIALVMTSGNFSDEPIVFDNQVALEKLSTVVDFFLLHNRQIHTRTDDSVLAIAFNRRPLLIRRSRGYVPAPINLPCTGPSVVCLGGDLKNTCCVTKGNQAIISQHIGDLEHPAAFDFLKSAIGHLIQLYEIQDPQLIVHDLHPDYHSTRLAEEEGHLLLPRATSNIPRLAVQHHHAHALSCLADNGRQGPALAICLDGTGFGPDGTIWGGELLLVDGLQCQRVAHLKPLALPGGEQAVHEPWRMGIAALADAFAHAKGESVDSLPPFSAAPSSRIRAVMQLLTPPNSCPLTSSAGRLFDAVASLLGLRHVVSFEGEAAMCLEAVASQSATEEEFDLDLYPDPAGAGVLDFAPFIRHLVQAFCSGASVPYLARLFHNSLCAALVKAVHDARTRRTIPRTIALSGGVFQNRLLLDRLSRKLENQGFSVLVHRQIPTNDGGLCLGQAYAGLLFCQRSSP